MIQEINCELSSLDLEDDDDDSVSDKGNEANGSEAPLIDSYTKYAWTLQRTKIQFFILPFK